MDLVLKSGLMLGMFRINKSCWNRTFAKILSRYLLSQHPFLFLPMTAPAFDLVFYLSPNCSLCGLKQALL